MNLSKSKYKPRMSPNIPGKLNVKRTILIGLAFLSSQAAWAYYNFIMPLMLREFYVDLKINWIGADTFVGMVMVLDNVVAVICLPYFGIISDHTHSKYGKRMPYIMIGVIVGAISFSFLPHMRIFWALFAVIMFFNLSLAFYRSAAMSLMPDLTDPKLRSTGNAIIQIMGALAFVLGYSGPIIMNLFYNVETYEGKIAARIGSFYFVSAIMLIALIFLFFSIKETPTGDNFLKVGKLPISIDPITFENLGEHQSPVGKKENKLTYLKTVLSDNDKSSLFMLLALFASNFGFNAIETFYSSFATLYLGWTDSMASTVLMIAPISLVISAYPVGKLSDKFGRKNAITLGLIGLSFTVEILHYLDLWLLNPSDYYIGNIICIFSAGFFLAMISINGIVIIWQLAPEGKIGAYTGVYYLFTQAAAIISPVVAGFQFDMYTQIFPEKIQLYGSGYQYRMLFFYVLTWQLIALLFISQVKKGESEEFTKSHLKNLAEQYGDV